MLRKVLWTGVLIAGVGCGVPEADTGSETTDVSKWNKKMEEALDAFRFQEADSLARLIMHQAKEDGDDQTLITVKTQKAVSLLTRHRLEEALDMIQVALAHIEEYGTPQQKLYALIQLANIQDAKNRISESYEAINKAMTLVPEVQDRKTVAAAYGTRARIVTGQDSAEALRLYYKALAIFIEEDDPGNEAIARNNIGLIYHDMNDYESAIEEYEKAIRLNRQTGDKSELETNFNNLGNSLAEMGEKQAAIDMLHDAIEINRQMGVDAGLIRNYYNLADIYVKNGEYDAAHSWFRRAYEKSHSIRFPPGIMYNAIGRARVLFEMELYDEVLPYIEESRELAKQMGNLEMMGRTWDSHALLMEQQGRYSEALTALRQQQVYSDSLDEIRNRREMEEVRAAYEVDLAIAENELLRQELTYRERLSRNQRLISILLITGLLAIGSVLLLFFRNQKKLEAAYQSLKEKNRQITEKNREQDRFNEELKKLNNDKDQLVHLIVHDLRNPLFGVLGFLEMMSETVTGEVEKENLEMAKKSAFRLNMLISSLLDTHSLETETSRLVTEKVDTGTLITETIKNFEKSARDKNITVHIEGDSLETETHPPYLVRIMDNLVSNAIKFSPRNSSVYILTEQPGRDSWRLIIADEGPGISAHDQKKLFRMFGKLSARPSGEEESTGLGLYTVKMLIKRLNGNISVESQTGKGSRFICEFPILHNQKETPCHQ